MRGSGKVTKPPISLQDLRRKLYVKAKAEPSWRFWGLYVHVCKQETLYEAYCLANENNGAPGSDGVSLKDIEGYQVENADLTLTIDRADLETVVMGKKRLTMMIEEGTARATGDVGLLDKFATTMVTFAPDFEMVPGTIRPAPADEWNPYEGGVEMIRGE